MQVSIEHGLTNTSPDVVCLTAKMSEVADIIREYDPDYELAWNDPDDMYVHQFSVDALANWSEILAESDQEQLIKDFIYIAVKGYQNEPDGTSPFAYAYEAIGDSLSEAKSNDIVSLMALSPRSQAASGVPSGISKCRSMLGLHDKSVQTMSSRSKRSVPSVSIDLTALSPYEDKINEYRGEFLSAFVPMEVNKDG